MKKVSYFLIMLSLLISCSSVEYRDPDKAKGAMNWGFYEINKTTELMVDSIFNYLKNDWKKEVLIQVQKIRLKTSSHDIDAKMLANSIITNLIKKKIGIYDDSYFKETMAEIEKGQTGIIDQDYAIPVGKLQSPNFYLKGEIITHSSYEGNKEIISIEVTLSLKELETGRIRWQDQKKFLKVVKRGKYSF